MIANVTTTVTDHVTRTLTNFTTITSAALNPVAVPAKDPTFALGYFALAMAVTLMIIIVRILQVRRDEGR